MKRKGGGARIFIIHSSFIAPILYTVYIPQLNGLLSARKEGVVCMIEVEEKLKRATMCASQWRICLSGLRVLNSVESTLLYLFVSFFLFHIHSLSC
jgi:hypothetical protein